MKQTAVEWLEKRLLGIVFLDTEYSTIEYEKRINQAKEMEKEQRGYSEEEAMEFFIEGYKQRAELSNLIFDSDSRMFAIALFKQFKNK